jgi:hypothetical protein
MSQLPPRRSYNVGTVVMRRDGITQVKTREGWITEHRLVIQQRMNRDLEPGEKVFHLDNTLRGEKDFNDPKNLTVIRCRTTQWVKLTRSRVMFEPKKEKDTYRYVRPAANLTGARA